MTQIKALPYFTDFLHVWSTIEVMLFVEQTSRKINFFAQKH